jgi:hypothetical protein
MNKSKFISIFLLILLSVFLAGCIKKPQDNQQADKKQGRAQEESGKVENFTGSLMDVLKLGNSVKCTGSYSGEDGSMEMVVYASGKKSYSEMQVDAGEDGIINTYSIYDGEWMYTWTDQGMASKMNVSEMEDLAKDMPEQEDYEGAQMSGQQAFQQEFDYKCNPWVVDNSKFVPPSDIEFMDMGEMMKGFTEAMESGEFDGMMDSACSACEMMPTPEEVTECKADLGC